MARPPYQREIKLYSDRAVKELKPRSIVLYGSIARGDYGEWSDVDILVVSDCMPPSFLERLKLLSELNTTMAPIEAVGYTPSEFIGMLEARHPTALYAVADGKPLYDDGFFKEARQAFERVKSKFDLVRIDHGWESRSLPRSRSG